MYDSFSQVHSKPKTTCYHSLAKGKEEDLAFAREAAQGRLPKFVELLKFKGLNVGARIWGAVSSITSKELMISLPDGLRGYVPVREVSGGMSLQKPAAPCLVHTPPCSSNYALPAVPPAHAGI